MRDLWALENAEGSPMRERSGDACDSYHRWHEDLDIVRDLGLYTYRFSIEWSRIEPARGHVSRAALDRYRRMIDGCLERGLTPMVTLHHFTSPLWFHQGGGWTGPESAELFAAYTRAVSPILDGVGWVCTINEPNMLAMVRAMRTQGHAESVAGALPAPEQSLVNALVTAHRAAREELSAVPGLWSGWTVANQNFQAVPGAGRRPGVGARTSSSTQPRGTTSSVCRPTPGCVSARPVRWPPRRACDGPRPGGSTTPTRWKAPSGTPPRASTPRSW